MLLQGCTFSERIGFFACLEFVGMVVDSFLLATHIFHNDYGVLAKLWNFAGNSPDPERHSFATFLYAARFPSRKLESHDLVQVSPETLRRV